jgi:hypothetical protein
MACHYLERKSWIAPIQLWEFNQIRTAPANPIKTASWWLIMFGFWNAVLKSQKLFLSQSSTSSSIFECGIVLKLNCTVEDEDEHQTYFWEHKTKFHEVHVKYGHLIDFIRLDVDEIRRLVGTNPLAVSSWVKESSTGVFMLVVYALNRPKKRFPLQRRMMLFLNWIWQRHSTHGDGLGVGCPVREAGWSK